MRLVLLLTVLATQQAWPAHERTAPPARPVALVNGAALMSDRLQAVINTLLPMASFHQQVGADKLAEVRQRALSQMVEEELQYQDGQAAGLSVSAAEIDAAIADLASSYRSRTAFTAAMAKAGASVDGVRAELQRRLLIAKAYDREVGSRCATSAADARKYYDEHPGRFVEPEQLHVRAITISVDPSSGAAGWAAGRTRIESVRREIVQGLAFDDAARNYSTDPSAAKGGDMGTMHRGSLNPAFESAAVTLRPGETSSVIESLYGYHLIQIIDVLPPRARSFADVGRRLQLDLSEERCAAMKAAWLTGLRTRALIEYPQ